MGTATSRATLGLAALAIGCAGCGGSGQSSSGSATSATSPAATAGATGDRADRGRVNHAGRGVIGGRQRLRGCGLSLRQGAGAWPGSRLVRRWPTRPAGVRSRAIPAPRPRRSVPPTGRYLGYLNATPRQGEETLADWRTFRISHNHEEGDRSVVRLAYAGGLRFLDGHGNCVKDAYISGTGVHYIEIACLVSGAKASTVIVGAGPPSAWAQVSGSIERAIAGFRT